MVNNSVFRKFSMLLAVLLALTHYVSTNLAEVGSEKLRSNGGGRPSGAQEIKPQETGGGKIQETATVTES